MSHWMEISWNLFSSIFQQWHNWLVLALIVCTFLFKQQYRLEAFNWLYVLNLLLPWIVLVDFSLLLGDFFRAWYGRDTYEHYIFFQVPAYSRIYYILLIVSMLASCLFFFKRLRTHRSAILLILLLRNDNWIFYKLGELFGDYLPSWWSIADDQFIEKLVCHVVLFTLLTGTYWWLFKRNKLPFPSILKH